MVQAKVFMNKNTKQLTIFLSRKEFKLGNKTPKFIDIKKMKLKF